jgi:hypothetical protein
MPANKQTIAGMASSYHSNQDNTAGGLPGSKSLFLSCQEK